MTQSNNPSNDTAAVAVSTPTSSFSLERYCRELDNVRQNLPEAARQLKNAGVARVQIQYDGCGDSGQIESIVHLDAEGGPIDLRGEVGFIEDRLMELFYDLIQTRHPGWENNDGAFGEFEWDLSADKLHHTHNDRFTDYDAAEHEGL